MKGSTPASVTGSQNSIPMSFSLNKTFMNKAKYKQKVKKSCNKSVVASYKKKVASYKKKNAMLKLKCLRAKENLKLEINQSNESKGTQVNALNKKN